MPLDDYVMCNFNAVAEFKADNTGRIFSVGIQKYALPDIFSNGRCDSSKDFILCEQDVNELFNIAIAKIKGLRRKLIFMSTYQKLTPPKQANGGRVAATDVLGYSFRMKVLNSTFA